ncbi:hypothetical protein [Achromobacter sp. NFACC18-2]|uniref:hypothetical protein n=1 Tax=Achromobacter sp. NFACC18-2 TaxID=1564112 RepID=UPI0008D05A13|nr:hypothetical protein [Achromobacter sp. NFACC18-2]SEK09210.1 hypothetical protein SAMN03159494_05106 [Achromobacter sp. NFACC18-2]
MIPRPLRHDRKSQSPAAASTPQPRCSLVALTVRIDTLDALNVRLALHRELGDRIGVYLLSVDHAHARSTLQLQCERDELDALMRAVMRGLPRAEFGQLRPAAALTER